jgi:biopolymer transport protein ExbD
MKRAWLLCAVIACTRARPAGQSFTEAIQIICDAPAQADAEYWRSNLKNVEAITMFEAMGDLAPADRQQRLTAALAKAGLKSCRRFDTVAVPHAPVVEEAPGALAYDAATPAITATRSSIVIDGKKVLALVNGAPDAKDLDGLKLPRVTSYLEALAAQTTKGSAHRPRLALAIDPQLPYSMLAELIYSAQQAGWHDLGIVVVVGGKPMIIPISLPDAMPPDAALGMTLSIKADELDLWSTSGVEGTLDQPIAAVTKPSALAAALDEVVTRHWPAGTTRPAATRRIVVIADDAVAMQQVVDALAVVRTGDEGGELFPDIVLGVAR